MTGPVPTMTTAGARTFKIGDGGDNWWNQDSWRARGEYTFSPKTTVFFQFMRQRYGYGYNAYNSYVRDAVGKPVDSGAVTFDDGGVARRIALTPGTFLSGPGGGTGSLYNGRLIRSLTSRQRLQFSGGVSDQPDNWYVTPASTAILGSGSGTLSERPTRSWHGDAQWSWKKSSRHSLVTGTETRRESVEVSEFSMANYAVNSTVQARSYAAQGRARTQAVYAQDQVRVTERLQITVGGRLDYWNTSKGANNTFGTTLVNEYADRSRTSLNGKAAAVYQIAAGTTARASVGTAFRNPTIYNLYRAWRSSSGTLYLSNPDLDPEKLMSWEAGLVQRLGQKFQFEGTYYENRVRNLIYLQVDYALDSTGKTQIYKNAGKGANAGDGTLGQATGPRLAPVAGDLLSYSRPDHGEPRRPGQRRQNVSPMCRGTKPRVCCYCPVGDSAEPSRAATYRAPMATTQTRTSPPAFRASFDPFFEASASLAIQVTKHLALQGGGDNLLDRRYYASYIAPGRSRVRRPQDWALRSMRRTLPGENQQYCHKARPQ